MPGAAAAAQRDLAWLGLDWDESPERGGPYPPYAQSECGAIYDAALARLAAAGRLFPCHLSRKELQSIATAPHGHDGAPPYPAELRPRDLPADWLTAAAGDAALRFMVEDREERIVDRVQGEIIENPARTVGDFVLKRRDGLYAYQLAVVVDDIRMGITEVVRGCDLLDSTARQVQLIRALGGTPPVYAHIPMVVNAAGEKLSKRDAALTLAAIREAGVAPEALCGWLAHAVGLRDTPAPCPAATLIADFDWRRIRRESITLPPDAEFVARMQ
jgi:glutamyl-tRNA synthetase